MGMGGEMRIIDPVTTEPYVPGEGIGAGETFMEEEPEPTGVEAGAELVSDAVDVAGELLDPYIDAGAAAQTEIDEMPDFEYDDEPPPEFSYDAYVSPEDFEFNIDDVLADPGYQFRLAEGEKATMRSASAAGRMRSGRLMKEMTRFASGLAGQETAAAFGRKFKTWGANVQKGLTEYGIGYSEDRQDYLDEVDRYNTGRQEQYTNYWDQMNLLLQQVGAGQTAATNLASIGVGAATGTAANLANLELANIGAETATDVANIGAGTATDVANIQDKEWWENININLG